jgi:hypothetical protein
MAAGKGVAAKGLLGKLAAPFVTKAAGAGAAVGAGAAGGAMAGPLGSMLFLGLCSEHLTCNWFLMKRFATRLDESQMLCVESRTWVKLSGHNQPATVYWYASF